MTKLNIDLLHALNAQYLFIYNNLLGQNQPNQLQKNLELSNLKNQTNLSINCDKKSKVSANENRLIDQVVNQVDRKPRFNYYNLVQSILAEQHDNYQNFKFSEDHSNKKSMPSNQLSLSSSSSSSFLQTDLSSSSFSSTNSSLISNSFSNQLNSLNNVNLIHHQANSLNPLLSNAQCLKSSSNLPQLTNNFNQLNLAQQQFNQQQQTSLTNQYFNKQLQNNQFNLSNFNLDSKLINYCNATNSNDSTKIDFNCTNFLNRNQMLDKDNDLNRLSNLSKKSQNENNSLIINKSIDKRFDLANSVFCTGALHQQSKITNQIKCTQIRKTNRPKKQYICKYCLRAFTKSYNLTIHERTHTSK